MDAHLFQAATNSVDLVWWTDHDYVMDGISYRKTVHFTSPDCGKRRAWRARPLDVDRGAQRAAGKHVGRRNRHKSVLARRPGGRGSLHVASKSMTSATAKVGYFADSHPRELGRRGS